MGDPEKEVEENKEPIAETPAPVEQAEQVEAAKDAKDEQAAEEKIAEEPPTE
jgi:hypothetical protein